MTPSRGRQQRRLERAVNSSPVLRAAVLVEAPAGRTAPLFVRFLDDPSDVRRRVDHWEHHHNLIDAEQPLPAKGDRCLIATDTQGDFWCLAFDTTR